MKGIFALLMLPIAVGAFSPSPRLVSPKSMASSQHQQSSPFSLHAQIRALNRPFRGNHQLFMGEDSSSNDEELDCWNPKLRRIVASMASLGALETAYLTYTKLTGATQAFCGPDGGCDSVLTSSYAVIPLTNIPLAALGFTTYSTVAVLALLPLLNPSSTEANDTDNRIWLTATTTAMATFSVFLMSLLVQILHASCPFCVLSAALSIGMAGIMWIGGGLPEEARKDGVQASAGSFVTATLAALVLFLGANDTSSLAKTQFAGSPGGIASSSSQQTLLATANTPPAITTVSSERTMALSKDLQSLDARFYGAFWCSHCYDQKEAFGKKAFEKIPYIECSKDGLNQQSKLCKEKNVPGYPTWEISGKLYPGEQALEELEEIVQQSRK